MVVIVQDQEADQNVNLGKKFVLFFKIYRLIEDLGRNNQENQLNDIVKKIT